MLLEKTLEVKTNYAGSKETYESVKKQIEERFGPDEASNYNPYYNCMTYKQWLNNGYQVNKDEKGFISRAIIEKKDKGGSVIKRYPKKVILFYENQVSKINL